MVTKLSRKDKMFLIAMGIIIAIGLAMPAIKAYATTKPTGINSQGILEMSTDNVFNANDVYNLYNESTVLVDLSR